MAPNSSLGEKVRALRKQLKMTQQQLAGDDFTKSFISQIEKDEAYPSLKSLAIIARRLNKPVTFFLDETQSVEDTERTSEYVRYLASGRRAELAQQWEEAEKAYKKASESIPKGDWYRKGKVLKFLGMVNLRRGRLQSAIDFFERSVSAFNQGGPSTDLAAVLNALGAAKMSAGKFTDAREHFEKALTVVEEQSAADDVGLTLRLLTNLGICLSKLGSYDSAKKTLEEALNISRTHDEYYKYGEICMTLAAIAKAQGNTEAALAEAEKALQFFMSTGDFRMIMDNLYNISIIQLEAKMAEAALENLQKALNIAEKMGYLDRMARLRKALGDCQAALNRYDDALGSYSSVLDLDPEPELRSAALLALGTIHKRRGELERAIEAFETAAGILESDRGDSKKLAELYSELGFAYREMGNLEKANFYLGKSVELFRGL